MTHIKSVNDPHARNRPVQRVPKDLTRPHMGVSSFEGTLLGVRLETLQGNKGKQMALTICEETNPFDQWAKLRVSSWGTWEPDCLWGIPHDGCLHFLKAL